MNHNAEVLALVKRQADDEGLWFKARTAPEAYLQKALRDLHAAIEPGGRDAPPSPTHPLEAWLKADSPITEARRREELRDRFAMAALHPVIHILMWDRTKDLDLPSWTKAAACAYNLADAMLEQRAKIRPPLTGEKPYGD